MRSTITTAVLATLGMITTTAHATIGGPPVKLLQSDGLSRVNFGRSVRISGTTAICGVPWDDDNGLNSGSAVLFDSTTGQEIAKLLPGDGTLQDGFGMAVGISGTTAIVGAYLADHGVGSGSGAAYLFDTTTGQQVAKLIPGDGAMNEYFGVSVAISGTLAIVGAYWDDVHGYRSGSAYVFDTTTGQQIYKFAPADGAAGDNFGFSVAIDGTTAVIGAVASDHNGAQSGSAYVYDLTTGQGLGRLAPLDNTTGDSLGWSVAISGTTALVGAIGDDDNGSTSGSAYLFDTITGQQLAKLHPGDGAANDWFGVSVGISGTTAVVGAYKDDDNGTDSGSAYLFDTSTGQQLAKLLPGDGAADDSLGWSVGISGVTAIVGAYKDDDLGTDSGSAYLFCACPAAAWVNYGSGWPGTLGVPALSLGANPQLGATFALNLANSLGASTTGFLFFGTADAANQTSFGGTLLVNPSAILPIAIPAAGLSLAVPIADNPSLCGLDLYLQGFVRDAAASAGIAFSAGLHLTLGS